MFAIAILWLDKEALVYNIWRVNTTIIMGALHTLNVMDNHPD